VNTRSWRDRLSDGPLDPSFWFGDVSSRLPGIFRAGLGAILLVDALLTFPEVSELYGRDGVWPPTLGQGPLTGIADSTLHLVWALGCLALLAFTLGVFSRISALLSYAFLVVVHQRNSGITTGGDYLAQILVFFCIWLDAGAAFSVDARFRGAAKPFIAAAPWRAMQLHLALLYFATTRLKIRGGWLSGDGIYVSLQHLGFLRPPGAFFLEHPLLCRLSSYAVLSLEGAFAFFALSPVYGRKARLGAVACGLLVQLGVLSTMRVGAFTALMIWTCVLFLPATPREAKPYSKPRLAFGAMPVALVVLIAWGVFAGRRFPMPNFVNETQRRLGLTQPYDLFGATYEVAQWHATGRQRGGSEVEVLELAAPGLRSVVAWRFSSLYKLTFAGNTDFRVLSQWLCRRYESASGQSLDTIRLWKHARAPLHLGESRPFLDTTLYAGECAVPPRSE